MPKNTDVVTFSPRKGATGDDRYDWDAAGASGKITAGASDYSDPPTLAEVNARSGINQLIAEIRRQIAFLESRWAYSGWASSYSKPSYIDGSQKLDVTHLNSYVSYINTIRQKRDDSSFSYTVTANHKVGAVLKEFRKQIATDRIRSFPYTTTSGDTDRSLRYRRSNPLADPWPYPADTTGNFTTTADMYAIDQAILTTTKVCRSYRGGVWLKPPMTLPSIATAEINGYVNYCRVQEGSSETLRFYLSTSNSGPLSSSHWSLSTELGSISFSDLQYDFEYVQISCSSASSLENERVIISAVDYEKNDSRTIYPPGGPPTDSRSNGMGFQNSTLYPFYIDLFT